MSLLDQIRYDEDGSIIMTITQGDTLFLLRMADRGEEGYHLYVIHDWPGVEESIINEIGEEIVDGDTNEHGETFVDIFWDMLEGSYVGLFE